MYVNLSYSEIQFLYRNCQLGNGNKDNYIKELSTERNQKKIIRPSRGSNPGPLG